MGQGHWKRRDFLQATGAVLGAATLDAYGQAASTGKVIKMIIGFPPGQATDTVARLLAERMQAATGNAYVVDNRPGQGGSLALGITAKSAPDGNTMMLVHMSAMATNPHLYKSVPYDALKDFEAVGLVGDLPFVMVVNASLPVQNVAELVAYAKAHPNTLTNSSSGNGTVSHLAMEEFKRQAGISVAHVPYKGSAQGITDVIAGNVSMALESAPAVQPFVQSGKLRALAAGTTKRLAWIPNVPTLAELGYNGINAVTWLMLIYPAGTPKAMAEANFEVINKIVGNPEVQQRFATLGVLPRSSKSPEEADAYIRSEFAAWGAVVRRSGTVLE